MAEPKKKMATNLPGNQQLGAKPPFPKKRGSGDDLQRPGGWESADVYNDESGYEMGVADPQTELGGLPVGRFQKTVPPAIDGELVPPTGDDLGHMPPVRCMEEYYRPDQMSYLAGANVNYSGGETIGKGFTNVGGRTNTTTDHAHHLIEDARRKAIRPVDKELEKDWNKP